MHPAVVYILAQAGLGIAISLWAGTKHCQWVSRSMLYWNRVGDELEESRLEDILGRWNKDQQIPSLRSVK